eukprot:2449063-Pyramimonas_sp.AAC.1
MLVDAHPPREIIVAHARDAAVARHDLTRQTKVASDLLEHELEAPAREVGPREVHVQRPPPTSMLVHEGLAVAQGQRAESRGCGQLADGRPPVQGVGWSAIQRQPQVAAAPLDR